MKISIFLMLCCAAISSYGQLRTDAEYKIICSTNSAQVLRGGNPVTRNPELVCVYSDISEPIANSRWKVEIVKGGFYKIKNMGSGKYLAITGLSSIAAAGIYLRTDLRQPEIVWQVIQSGSASRGFTYKFRSNSSNLFLGTEAGSTANGTAAVQRSDEGQSDISWRMQKISEEPIIPGGEVPPGGESSHIMPKAEWQRLFTEALSGFRIKINNYTATANQYTGGVTYKFNKPNDNYIQFSEKIKLAFDMSYMRIGPATLYFIDLSNQPPSINTLNTEIKIEMNYDIRTNPQIFANCIENIACGGGMWWMNLTGMRMSIFLTPVIENGKITYTDARVYVFGTISSDGSNVIVENFNNGYINRMLANRIQLQLNTPEAKQFFRENFHNNLLRVARAAYHEMGIGATPSPYTRISVQPNGDLLFER